MIQIISKWVLKNLIPTNGLTILHNEKPETNRLLGALLNKIPTSKHIIYFPQNEPFYKTRSLVRTLKNKGNLFVSTDYADIINDIDLIIKSVSEHENKIDLIIFNENQNTDNYKLTRYLNKIVLELNVSVLVLTDTIQNVVLDGSADMVLRANINQKGLYISQTKCRDSKKQTSPIYL